jgi:hypothetical protein
MKTLKLILSKLLLIIMTPFIFCIGGVLFIIFVWDTKYLIFIIEILQGVFNKKELPKDN